MKRPSFYLNERIQAAGAMESRSRGARLDEAAVTKGQGVYVYDHLQSVCQHPCSGAFTAAAIWTRPVRTL